MTWETYVAIIGAVAFLAAWLGIKLKPEPSKRPTPKPWDAWWDL